MERDRASNKNNLIFTIVIIILVVAIAAGMFLFFTLYDWNGANRSDQPPASVTSSQLTSSGQANTSTTSSEFKQLDDPLLVLVNAEHQMPAGTDSRVIEQFDVKMDERALVAYNEMRNAASNAGVNLWVSSAYRAPALQSQLYQQEINDNLNKGMTKNDAIAAAGKAVQKPGYSEHNTGLAMDLNGVMDSFKNSKEYAWLMRNAADYGFVLRYPKDKEDITGIMYEPWHFRYVGVDHAKEMKKRNMCLEEYVEYVRSQQS